MATTYDDTIFTTVTNDPDEVSDWISDVKWRPSFTRHYQNPVATLQICVGRRCLIYQIQHSPYIPQTLVDFLSDYTFVGVGVQSDLEKLDCDYGFGESAYSVDLGWLASEAYDWPELEAERIGENPVGRGWDNWSLSAEQVQYATVDAFVSFENRRILNAYNY